MMHLNLEQLSALQDGEADVTAADHLERCARCRTETRRLEEVRSMLADLPEVGPDRDLWPAIAAAVDRRASRRRVRRSVVLASSAAAAVFLVWMGFDAGRGPRVPTHPEPAVSATDCRVAIDQLVSASRELERLLDAPALRSRVMGPRQAATIVTLEDEIAEIDAVFAASTHPVSDDEAISLWSNRVRLLAALVQARGAPAASARIQHAVHSEGRL